MRQPDRITGPETELRAVAQIELPAGVDPAAVLERLTGRWFGSLRWMGVVDRPDGRLLAWARRDGSGSVLLGIQRGTVRIFATGDVSLVDPSESEDAAYELLVALADTLRPHSVRSSVMFLADQAPNRGRPRIALGALAGAPTNN